MARVEWLTCGHFAGRLGEGFVAVAGDGVRVPLELVEATEGTEPGGPGPEGQPRLQFSLVFLGPSTPVLPQGTYPVDHAEFEDLVLFLVPLGPDGAGMRYEAAFA